MPPKKTYVFECLSNANIKISIEAYSLEQAFYILIEYTKHPSDFKTVSK